MPRKTLEERREYQRQYRATAHGRAKVREANARWRAKNPERMRELHNTWRARTRRSGYAKKYYDEKIRPRLYADITRPQPAACESCGDLLVGRKLGGKIACVDHNHATGKFRGWLCQQCNAALGMLKDDPIRVEALLRYIRRA